MGFYGLDRLVAPISRADFVASHFETSPLAIARNEPEYYAGLLSVADVEALVFSLNAPDNRRWFQLIKNGQTLPIRPPLVDERGDLVPNEVVARYEQGYTIVLNQLQRRWSPIRAFCDSLGHSMTDATGTLLKGNVTANAYLTPAGTSGFAAHHDDHEVFILQLEGRKEWRVYAPLVLFPVEPLTRIPGDRLGEPLRIAWLDPGDLLYIPRGFVHHARAAQTHSLHLTAGVRTWTWADFIFTVARSDAAFRRSVSVDPSRFRVTAPIESLLNLICDDDRLLETLHNFSGFNLATGVPAPTDYLDAVHRLAAINQQMRLRKRHGTHVLLNKDRAYLTLYFPGGMTRIALEAEAALRFIIGADEFAVGEIPGLSPADGFSLIRSLVGQGFLTMVKRADASA